MNNQHSNSKEDVICHCTGTTQTKIENLLVNDVDTLEKIAYETGATTGCGACEYDISQLIVQHGKSQ